MNAISKAIQEIKAEIPMAVLQAVFGKAWYDTANSNEH